MNYRLGENPFVARITAPLSLPNSGRNVYFKVYVHRIGFENSFRGSLESAEKYFKELISERRMMFYDFQYVLGTLFGKNAVPVADLFGFGEANGLTDSRLYSEMRFKDWRFSPPGVDYKGEETIGDTLIMLGEEEKFRRRVSNLEEFVNAFPTLRWFRGSPKIINLGCL